MKTTSSGPTRGFLGGISRLFGAKRALVRQAPDAVEEPLKVKVLDDDVQLLLAEYDRLKMMQINQREVLYTRFNSFMTIALGLAAAYVALLGAGLSVDLTKFPIPDLIAAVVLLWGVLTFWGLLEISHWLIHLEKAIRLIQVYFCERYPDIKNHLYFEDPALYMPPSNIDWYFRRWVLGGSPKRILAFLNGGVAAILAARFLAWQEFPIGWAIVGGAASFVITVGAHAGYLLLEYSSDYITSRRKPPNRDEDKD